MPDQSGFLETVLADEGRDVLGHGVVVVHWCVRRVAVVSQILPGTRYVRINQGTEANGQGVTDNCEYMALEVSG